MGPRRASLRVELDELLLHRLGFRGSDHDLTDVLQLICRLADDADPDLLIGLQEIDTPDLAEIHTHRIIDEILRSVRPGQLLLDLIQLIGRGLIVPVDIREEISVVRFVCVVDVVLLDLAVFDVVS